MRDRFGLLWGLVVLVRLPAERRMRRRVKAVEAAAGGVSPYSAPIVYASAKRLFGDVQGPGTRAIASGYAASAIPI